MKPGHTYCTVNIFGSKWGHILRYWFAYFSGGKIPLFGVYWFEYQTIKHTEKKVKIIKYIWGKWRNCHFKTKNVHVVHFDIDFLLALPSFYEFFVWTFCRFCTSSSSSRQGLLQIFISRKIISKVKFMLGVYSIWFLYLHGNVIFNSKHEIIMRRWEECYFYLLRFGFPFYFLKIAIYSVRDLRTALKTHSKFLSNQIRIKLCKVYKKIGQ